MISLFKSDSHCNVMFNDLATGSMVQSNQHIIVHDHEGILLDPGGHKVYSRLLSEMTAVLPVSELKHIFFSHQDPDIVAAANGWLMVTDAEAHLSEVWMRFIPHFGVDKLVMERIKPIPDSGLTLRLGGVGLKILPAHFLHSAGNFQIYDPVSKILYSGDLGASLGQTYDFVEDFDAHVELMEGFHKRYMPTAKALKMWVNMVRTLDIEIIAPQHGAVLGNRELVGQFIDWVDGLTCGVDEMADAFAIPE